MGSCCLNNRQYTRFQNSSEFTDLLKNEKDQIKIFINQPPTSKNEVDDLNYTANLSEIYTSLNYLDKKLSSEKEGKLNREYLNGVIELLDHYYELKESKLNDKTVSDFKQKVNEFLQKNQAREESVRFE